jgi:hypothetical protein
MNVFTPLAHNADGLAMGWYFIMSSPEMKMNIIAKVEINIRS